MAEMAPQDMHRKAESITHKPATSNGLVLLLSGDAARAATWMDGLDRAGFPVDSGDPLCRDQTRVGAADVLVLDISGSVSDTVTSIRWLRDGGLAAYILALVQPGDVAAVLQCLDAGADACANRDCSVRELTARIRALVRRTRRTHVGDVIQIGDVCIDLLSHTVRREQRRIALSPLEYALLLAIARRRGSVVSRDELLADVWGASTYRNGHVIDSAITCLRRKIERDPTRPQHVITVRSVGYLIPS